MFQYALKILIGDRAKYIGIILGLSFSSLIITQQSGIFVGIMARTCGFISDTPQGDIWVMDRKVQYVDDVTPMKETELYRVKSVEGVAWAAPLYKGFVRTRMLNGDFQTCVFIGVDEATLIGAPPRMIEGSILNLRHPDTIIIDEEGARTKLALTNPLTDKKDIPLRMGDIVEINDHFARVGGVCKASRLFYLYPVIYTTYSRALTYSPPERKMLSFILVKAEKGVNPLDLCDQIEKKTGLVAYTRKEFQKLTIHYFLTQSPIPINFGITVLLGFIIGTAIAGQTFYNFVMDNLKYFGTFKAMGASNLLLIRMILLQAVWVGAIGWGIGMGAASIFGLATEKTELSFMLPWQLYLLSMITMLFICFAAAYISLRKIIKLEPAIVFKS